MKISADLIDLDLSPQPEDDPPITVRYKPKPRVIQLDAKKQPTWAHLNSQVLQALNQNPYTSSIGIYFKKQNKKVFINSDKTLQEAMEYVKSQQGGQLQLTAVELNESAGEEDEAAARSSVKFVPEVAENKVLPSSSSSQKMSDEEELAWVKQHGWMRALIKKVEAKAHAVTVAHLATLLNNLSPAEAKIAGLSDFGVVCNLCNTLVTGPYYKCSVCEDFDLCPGCETKDSAHDESHPLLKIKTPGQGRGEVVAKKFASTAATHHSSGVKRKREKHFLKVPKHSGFMAYNADCKESRHMYSVEPGQAFTEVWTIENTGLKAWDRHVYLKCLANSGATVVPFMEKVAVAPRLPCEVARIPVVFNILPGAPQGPNPCISMWRLCRKDSQFGPTLVTTFTIAPPRNLPQKETIAQVLTAAVSDDQPSVKRKAFISSTNTPNNTPFVLSPPKSPEPPAQPEAEVKLPEDDSKPDEDEGRCSSNTSESEDSEFVVIPCPLGPSGDTPSTTVVEKETGEDQFSQELESINESMAVLSMDGTVSSIAPEEEEELEPTSPKECSSPELEEDEAFRCLVTKVNLLRQSTAVKTCLTPYPQLSELAEANASLSEPPPKAAPQTEEAPVPEAPPQPQASDPSEEAPAAPAAATDNNPQQQAQATAGTSPPPPAFPPPYPHEGIPPMMNVVNGMAKVYNTAKAVLQHLTPPGPRVEPPSPATSEQGEFVYPQEAWIGNNMTTQEYQYFEWKFAPVIQCFHEMGFRDRIRIEFLLQKFNGDVNKVANTLLCDPADDPDNNWFLTRHRAAFDFD